MFYFFKDTFNEKFRSSRLVAWCNSDVDLVNLDRKFIAYISVIVSILMTIYTS